MQPGYFFATVTAVTAILVIAFLILFHWMRNLIQSQNSLLLTLTNLATSKNLETFQNLQWTTMRTLDQQSQSAPVEPIPVLDDISLAHALAERNKAMGQDPNRAYNMEDDVDFGTEFGLNG
jgi:hypothetical protein